MTYRIYKRVDLQLLELFKGQEVILYQRNGSKWYIQTLKVCSSMRRIGETSEEYYCKEFENFGTKRLYRLLA